MLSRLSIINYALIERLELQPGGGLSIITGETGAGKSIMLGALSLIMGERADMKVIAEKDKKAVVEASFINLPESLNEKIKQLDPEWDGSELIVRREIYPSGRSRAFINDSPATLAQLEDISRGLLDIHSQNSNSILAEQSTQLLLIDAVADNNALLREYSSLFNRYVDLRQNIKRIKDDKASLKDQAEIIAFRLDMLNKLKPKADELKKIEIRYESLCNAEELRNSLIKARRFLDGGELPGALEQIDDASSALANIDFSIWEEQDPYVVDRLHQCVIEIKDILETVDSAIGATEYEPAVLAALSSRMNDYYAALKYFKVDSDRDLVSLYSSLRDQYDMISSGEGSTKELETEAKSIAADLKKKAALISSRRKVAASLLQKEIQSEARKLGLENLLFEIKISDAKLSRSGGDSVSFLSSFNKNSRLAPVGELASGGEMARLMLAVKKITSSNLELPTVIFDEIDTGVSGNIADKMGEMMKEMGSKMQILTITHLPQVAVKGDRHFKVYKEEKEDKSVSNIMLLSDSEREMEIGRMLSGEVLDEAALSNARSLLKKK